MAEVRFAEREDVQDIFDLIGEMGYAEVGKTKLPPNRSPELLESLIFDQKAGYFLIAREDGKAVGFCAYCKSVTTMNCRQNYEVKNLYVTKEYRRRGIGTQMLSMVQQKAKEEGMFSIEFFTISDHGTNDGLLYFLSKDLKPREVRLYYVDPSCRS